MPLSALVATLLALATIILPGPAAADPTATGIVVIGATAKSSTEIIRQALAAGYTVTGVARHPEDVTLKDAHLKVLKGDVYDLTSLEAAMTGTEVVISMVGPRIDPRYPQSHGVAPGDGVRKAGCLQGSRRSKQTLTD